MASDKTTLMAVIGASVLAVGFICEPETYPVFMDWVKTHKSPNSPDPIWDREVMIELLRTLLRMQAAGETFDFPR